MDVDAMGAMEVLSRVVNLNECADGLYVIDMTNVSRDFESGEIGDYDYRLTPYVEKAE